MLPISASTSSINLFETNKEYIDISSTSDEESAEEQIEVIDEFKNSYEDTISKPEDIQSTISCISEQLDNGNLPPNKIHCARCFLIKNGISSKAVQKMFSKYKAQISIKNLSLDEQNEIYSLIKESGRKITAEKISKKHKNKPTISQDELETLNKLKEKSLSIDSLPSIASLTVHLQKKELFSLIEKLKTHMVLTLKEYKQEEINKNFLKLEKTIRFIKKTKLTFVPTEEDIEFYNQLKN